MLKEMGREVTIRVLATVLAALVLFAVAKVFAIPVIAGMAIKSATKKRG